MDNFYGPLSVRIYMTPYLNWEKLGGGRGVTRKERGITLCCPSPDYRRFVNLVYEQPRPQGFSLKKWVGREKALASAGHVSHRTP